MSGIWSIIFSSFILLAIVGVVLVVLTDERSSSEKLLWIALVVVFPVVGLILYLLLGINFRTGSLRQRNHKPFKEMVGSFADPRIREIGRGAGLTALLEPQYRPFAKLLGSGLGSAVTTASNIEIFTEGQEKLERLMEDIRGARHYIHMEYFYFRKGEMGTKFKDLLKEKAREGVKVRFIRENIANFDILPHYYNEMREAGVEVVKFTPTFSRLLTVGSKLNYRDHRKIAIIDGHIAYTGGMNISDDYYSKWRDTHVRFTGQAVAALQLHFLDSYITSGGRVDESEEMLFPTLEEAPSANPVQIFPGDPDTPWPTLSMEYEWLLYNARDYFWIQTPYLLPPEPVMQALKAAALRGVDVRLMVPREADIWLLTQANRAYYPELLKAGVRIFENKGRFIHSKTFVSDGYVSAVGSTNLDFRSLELSYEMSMVFYGSEIAARNREIFLKDLNECTELSR
ncbi:MAG: cardiolipin synthase [Bacteroidia bacterium]|nr:cardiolipin synthase [Bacteroidia bacterium]